MAHQNEFRRCCVSERDSGSSAFGDLGLRGQNIQLNVSKTFTHEPYLPEDFGICDSRSSQCEANCNSSDPEPQTQSSELSTMLGKHRLLQR